jgi:PAS domain S-box-containing protein
VILLITVIAAAFLAIYINGVLKIEVVYTHLFYIPIILAGIWYYKKAVYVALFLGALHLALNFIIDGSFEYDALIRAFMFLAIAYIVGTISEKKDSLYKMAKNSESSLLRMQDSLESLVIERTAELSGINASLRQEIIERERAEKAFRESQEKFRILAESSPAIILLYRGDRLLYSNHAAELFTGYTREELLSMDFWSLIHPDDRESTRDRAAARIRGEPVPSRYETRVVTRTGLEKWFDISAEVIDYEGMPAGLMSGIDITDRKNAEKALIKSRAILSRAQSIAHVGNWAWDLKTGNIQWSDEIFHIFGLAPQSVKADTVWLLAHIHPEDRDLVLNSVRSAINENKLFNIDHRIIAADGSIRYINLVADKLRRSSAGDPIWLYGIVQDISERKRVEEALKDAKAQAELYLDLMGHDINNMNQIGMGFLEIALDTLELDENARQMLSRPLEALESSTRLIANVRKLQRAKDGNLLHHALDVGEFLDRLVPQFSNVAGREIAIHYTAGQPCPVIANDLISDVFSNIIGNAIKHSQGPLDICINLFKKTIDDKPHCVVEIADNGPGIPDDIKSRLLSGSSRIKMYAGGRGLGLYLVRTLVEDFHGSVRIEDRIPGDYTKGCRFIILLPCSEK